MIRITIDTSFNKRFVYSASKIKPTAITKIERIMSLNLKLQDISRKNY